MQRFRIATNPDKQVPEGVVPRDIDKEDYIKLMIMFGIEPVYSEGDDRVIWVYFLPDEVEQFESIYLSNKNPLFTVQMWSYAQEFWRNLMVSWRSKLRHIEATARAQKVANTYIDAK